MNFTGKMRAQGKKIRYHELKIVDALSCVSSQEKAEENSNYGQKKVCCKRKDHFSCNTLARICIHTLCTQKYFLFINKVFTYHKEP